ncbi:MAG: hypothetical protein N3F05_04560 [Candidatus Diapherotrites archaeon]|nr:hypothetical protein [Candidatus Diapherotrites archaeon]
MALGSYLKVVKAQKEAQKPASSPLSSEVYTPKPDQGIGSGMLVDTKENVEAWKTCQHLKVKDNEPYCSYFVAKCGMDRCNKRFLSITKKIPKL